MGIESRTSLTRFVQLTGYWLLVGLTQIDPLLCLAERWLGKLSAKILLGDTRTRSALRWRLYYWTNLLRLPFFLTVRVITSVACDALVWAIGRSLFPSVLKPVLVKDPGAVLSAFAIVSEYSLLLNLRLALGFDE